MVTSLTWSPRGGVKLNSEIILLYWLASPNIAKGCAGPRTVAVGFTSPCVALRKVSVLTEIFPGAPEKAGILDQSPALFSRSSIGLLVTKGSDQNCITLPAAV